MYGVEEFVAVLNPPQVAILAVGAVKDTPVVVDGEVGVAPMMHVTLTCDHRAIDGADGAEFLRTLMALVEQPVLALYVHGESSSAEARRKTSASSGTCSTTRTTGRSACRTRDPAPCSCTSRRGGGRATRR